MIRSTHTFSILELSFAAYEEIKRKLIAADYRHCIIDMREGEVIDMQGIAVKKNEGDIAAPSEATDIALRNQFNRFRNAGGDVNKVPCHWSINDILRTTPEDFARKFPASPCPTLDRAEVVE